MCTPNVTVGIYSDLNSQDDEAMFGSIVNDPANSTNYTAQVLGIRVFMVEGFDFPQPQNNPKWKEVGLPATVSIGCCFRKENVRVISAEKLGGGLQYLKLRRVDEKTKDGSPSLTWSVPKSTFGESSGRSCR